jgi:hypothetical protein
VLVSRRFASVNLHKVLDLFLRDKITDELFVLCCLYMQRIGFPISFPYSPVCNGPVLNILLAQNYCTRSMRVAVLGEPLIRRPSDYASDGGSVEHVTCMETIEGKAK